MLNRERETVAARGAFPYGSGDARSGFSRPLHAHLPAPYSTSPPNESSSRMDAFSAPRPGDATLGSNCLSLHAPPPRSGSAVDDNHCVDNSNVYNNVYANQGGDRRRATMLESDVGGRATTMAGRSTTPSTATFPPYGFDRQQYRGPPHERGVERIMSEMAFHRASWQGPDGSYAGALTKYHGERPVPGNESEAGAIAGRAAVAHQAPEMTWASQPQAFEGGRRIVH